MSLLDARLPSLKDKLESKVDEAKLDEVLERITSPKKVVKLTKNKKKK